MSYPVSRGIRPFLVSLPLAAGAILLLALGAQAAFGGPDDAGYRWADDPADGAPAYAWESIAPPGGPGQALTWVTPPPPQPQVAEWAGIDFSSTPTGMGEFPFYGDDWPGARVHKNGLIQFLPTSADVANHMPGGSPTGCGLECSMSDPTHPDISAPNTFVSACWVNMRDPSINQGKAWHYWDVDAGVYIIEWNGFEYDTTPPDGGRTGTFQIRLHADGVIDVVVNRCDSAAGVGRHSIGIENRGGTIGLHYRNTTNLVRQEWVRFQPNRPPVGIDDVVTTFEDTAVDIYVVANDEDIHDAIHPENDTPFQILSVTSPMNGDATHNGTHIKYTPALDTNDRFRGGQPDSFTYTFVDKYGAEGTATVNVSVTPVNDPPSFTLLPNPMTVDEEGSPPTAPWITRLLPGPETALDEMEDAYDNVTIEMTAVSGSDLFADPPSLETSDWSYVDGRNMTVDFTLHDHLSGIAEYDIVARDTNGTDGDPGDDLTSTPVVRARIEVRSINDPPEFTPPADPVLRDPVVAEDSSVYLQPWATGVRPGPAAADDEMQTQNISWIVWVDDSSLFTQGGQPRLVPDLAPGAYRLKFTPAPDRFGVTGYHVMLRDDNGTSAWVADDLTNLTQVHGQITIKPVNDPPSPQPDHFVHLLGPHPSRIYVLANDESTPDPAGSETLRILETPAADLEACEGAPALGTLKIVPAAEGEPQHVKYLNDGTETGAVCVDLSVGDDGQTWDATDGLYEDPKSATARLTIQLVTLASAAEPDAYTTGEDTPLVVGAADGVLANDPMPSGVARSAGLVEPPAHGALSLYPDGRLRYEPEEDYFGRDSFRYHVDFGSKGTSDPVVVTIEVEPRNDAPLARGDLYRLPPDRTTIVPVSSGVLANDEDRDGDQMTAHLTQWGLGHVVLDPAGSFRYTPPPGFRGDDVFTYEVRDGSGPGNVVAVEITVAENRAPKAQIITESDSVPSGIPFQFRDGSVDPDGQLIRWLWEFGDGTTSDDREPRYTFPVPGEYHVTLTVTDDGRAKSTVRKTILVTAEWNAEDGGTYKMGLPRADAGDDRIALHGSRVLLDGSAGDGQRAIGWKWTQVTGPNVTLSNPDGMQTSFEAPHVPPGGKVVLEFDLVIYDAQYLSLPDRVRITVKDSLERPEVNAGNDLTRQEGTMIHLEAASTAGFPAGSDITYTWFQVGGPNVGLGNQVGGPSTFFRAPPVDEATAFVFRVVATDGIRTTDADEVVITIEPLRTVGDFLHLVGEGDNSLIVAFEPRLHGIDVLHVEWDFGDGNRSQKLSPVHGYEGPGLYTVRLNVTLQDGEIVQFEHTIEVGAGLRVLDAAGSRGAPVAPLGLGILAGLAAAAVLRRRG